MERICEQPCVGLESWGRSTEDVKDDQARVCQHLSLKPTEGPTRYLPSQSPEPQSRLKSAQEFAIVESCPTKPVDKHRPTSQKPGDPTRRLHQGLPPIDVDAAPFPVDDTPVCPKPMVVSRDTYDVLARLWPSPNIRTGSIRWREFLNAMAEAGFYVEPTGGSVFSFLRDGKVILTHRPHPSSKLEAITARAYGRRLQRRLHINLEHFTLKETEPLHDQVESYLGNAKRRLSVQARMPLFSACNKKIHLDSESVMESH